MSEKSRKNGQISRPMRFTKLSRDDIGNLNRLITRQIQSVIKIFSTKKSPGLDSLTRQLNPTECFKNCSNN